MVNPGKCFKVMQKDFFNYHCVGASFNLLCHLYCKLSRSNGSFLTF